MEACRDGGRGSFWRYQTTGGLSSYYSISNGSSSSGSGTIVSTAYTSTGSHLSCTSISMEAAAMHLDSELEKMDKDNKVKQIESLVQEYFFFLRKLQEYFSYADRSKGGGMSVLQRWFTELGIDWVLHLGLADDGASSGSEEQLQHANRSGSWILALAKITDTIRHTMAGNDFLFAWFTRDAMSKMLAFVDVVASQGSPVSYGKLSTLLGVHGALTKALSEMRMMNPSPRSPGFGRIEREVTGLLRAKKGKAGKAIWGTMEEYKSRILELQQDGRGDSDDESSDIHKANQSMKSYIMLLQANYLSAGAVVSQAATLGKYVPLITYISPLDSMIVEMTLCLEEKLVSVSESFSDRGLRFLFLLNNSHFMMEELHQDFWIYESRIADLDFKVKAYMKSYVQESWAPVVSCLFDPIPLGLLIKKNYSPLLRFESKFQKTYTTQKLWKVPDPTLRNGLRTAITERIIPSYTKYIADNNVATARFTPQELEEMLQELFEG